MKEFKDKVAVVTGAASGIMEKLKEYYQLRGWDKDTRLPTRETLVKLGMEDLCPAS